MDGNERFYERPGFPPVAWTVVALIGYAASIYFMPHNGLLSYAFVILDVVLFLVGMWIWLGFFAQFVLPVLRFRERQKIFDRLVSFVLGGQGPAIFVKDGLLVAGEGEAEKKGAGVIWLDSASALQLRTQTKFTRSLGPGVHFTEKGEYIAGVVDLHQQAQGIGPQGKEDPFAPKSDSVSKEEYEAIQKRRNETSALTRNGIEVVPNINVTFKIDADQVEGDGPGSRFGYRETEKPEENPVFRAIVGEGINPSLNKQPAEKQIVPWNKLPAMIAADLWREYLSKFTLRELFESTQEIPADKPVPLEPTLAETTALFEPVLASTQNAWQDSLAELLHEFNRTLHRWVDQLESETMGIPPQSKPVPAPPPAGGGSPRKATALEVINVMIKARMTQPFVDEMDANGQRTGKQIESQEYILLKKRGIKVLAAGAGSLRFVPNVEEQLVRQWNVNWLSTARAERDAIERLRKQKEIQGQDRSLADYTRSLGKRLLKKRPVGGKETLRYLLATSRDELIRHDRLHRRLSNEITEIDDILQWL